MEVRKSTLLMSWAVSSHASNGLYSVLEKISFVDVLAK